MENAFLDRLKVEKDELLDKVTKLATFLAKQEMIKKTLSDANLILLNQQVEVMKTYLDILIIRIELLTK
jgi:hypothetical protein